MTRALFLGIASLTALAACNSNSDQAAEQQPTAAATPEPVSPEPSNATETPVLTPEGWGPLRIGMTLNEVTEALGPDANPDAVGGPEPDVCTEFRPERAPEGMFLMIQEGILTRISLDGDSDIETADGISVGDSAEAVRAAYGSRLRASGHQYLDSPAEYLTVWTAAPPDENGYSDDPKSRGIRFETDENRKVTTIHAGGSSIQYVEGCA